MNFPEWVSVMSVREVLDVVLSYIKVFLSWPAVVFIALIIFRRRIGSLIERVKSVAPTKVSFYDVSETVQDARAAAEQAASRLQEDSSVKGTSDVEEQAQANDVGDALRPDDDADESNSRATLSDDDRAEMLLRVPTVGPVLERLRRRQEQTSMRRRLQSRSSQDAAALVERAWEQLEQTSLEAAKSLGLSTDSRMTRPRRIWTPLEVFQTLYLDGRGSREAIRAVENAMRVRNDIANGAVIDADEAQALADALDELSDTAVKLVRIKNGEKVIRSWLDRHGHETLPEADKPG